MLIVCSIALLMRFKLDLKRIHWSKIPGSPWKICSCHHRATSSLSLSRPGRGCGFCPSIHREVGVDNQPLWWKLTNQSSFESGKNIRRFRTERGRLSMGIWTCRWSRAGSILCLRVLIIRWTTANRAFQMQSSLIDCKSAIKLSRNKVT